MSFFEMTSTSMTEPQREALVDTWLAGQIQYTVAGEPPHGGNVEMAGCETCAECATYEFQPENIAPLYNNRSHFLRAQWRIPWVLYVVYRVGVAILIAIWLVADFWDEASQFYSDNYALWFIFATNWGFLFLGVSAIMHAAIVVKHFTKTKGNCRRDLKPDESSRGLDVPMMVFWVIYNVAFNGAIVVTVSYWSFLVSVDRAGFLVTPMSRIKHTLNTVYVIFDMMFSGVPVRIFHVIYPLFLGAIYTVFNVLYFTNNGVGPNGQPYAYYVMDWRNPLQSALTCSVGFIFTTIMQCVMYGVYRLRLCLYGYVMNERYDAIALEHGDLLESSVEGSDEEHENILGEHRNRAMVYSSVENLDSAQMSDSAEGTSVVNAKHSAGGTGVTDGPRTTVTTTAEINKVRGADDT